MLITVRPHCQTHLVSSPVAGGNRRTRRKPTTFGQALTCYTRGLGSNHIEKPLLTIKPSTLGVKGDWFNQLR